MGFSKQMALDEEEASYYERKFLDAERDHNVDKLFHSVFGADSKTNIVKVARKDAKKHYLYKRLDGKMRLV